MAQIHKAGLFQIYGLNFSPWTKISVIPWVHKLRSNTLKPRPEAHMDMILFEMFLKSIDLISQQQILQRHYSYYR